MTVCRVCLNTSKIYHKMCSGLMDGLQISQVLKIVIPEIYLGVSKNPIICNACLQNLTTSYAFRKKMMETESHINDYLLEVKFTHSHIDLFDVVTYITQKTKKKVELKCPTRFRPRPPAPSPQSTTAIITNLLTPAAGIPSSAQINNSSDIIDDTNSFNFRIENVVSLGSDEVDEFTDPVDLHEYVDKKVQDFTTEARESFAAKTEAQNSDNFTLQFDGDGFQRKFKETLEEKIKNHFQGRTPKQKSEKRFRIEPKKPVIKVINSKSMVNKSSNTVITGQAGKEPATLKQVPRVLHTLLQAPTQSKPTSENKAKKRKEANQDSQSTLPVSTSLPTGLQFLNPAEIRSYIVPISQLSHQSSFLNTVTTSSQPLLLNQFVAAPAVRQGFSKQAQHNNQQVQSSTVMHNSPPPGNIDNKTESHVNMLRVDQVAKPDNIPDLAATCVTDSITTPSEQQLETADATDIPRTPGFLKIALRVINEHNEEVDIQLPVVQNTNMEVEPQETNSSAPVFKTGFVISDGKLTSMRNQLKEVVTHGSAGEACNRKKHKRPREPHPLLKAALSHGTPSDVILPGKEDMNPLSNEDTMSACSEDLLPSLKLEICEENDEMSLLPDIKQECWSDSEEINDGEGSLHGYTNEDLNKLVEDIPAMEKEDIPEYIDIKRVDNKSSVKNETEEVPAKKSKSVSVLKKQVSSLSSSSSSVKKKSVKFYHPVLRGELYEIRNGFYICDHDYIEDVYVRKSEVDSATRLNFHCYICDYEGKLSTVEEHMETHSNLPDGLRCKYCGKYFDAPFSLNKHIMMHSTVCKVCKESVKVYLYREHKEMHNKYYLSDVPPNVEKNVKVYKVKEFKCSTCDSYFVKEGMLTTHQKLHELTTESSEQPHV